MRECEAGAFGHLYTFMSGGQCDLSVELSLGKCRQLIGWCTSSNPESNVSLVSIQSAQILAYSTILETVLSEVYSWDVLILGADLYTYYNWAFI